MGKFVQQNGPITVWRAMMEVGLIVIGIMIALGFDSWMQTRQDKRQELELLINVEEDLKVMIQRSEEAIRFNTVCYNAGKIILDDLKDPSHKVYNDSLNKYYGTFYFFDYPEIKQSGLVTLQSVGVDLITNDSLRIAIIDFYDLHSLKATYLNESYTRQYNDVIDPIMHESIQILSLNEEAKPVDYAGFKKDVKALNTLNNILFHRQLLMKHIRTSIPHMEELKTKIRKEIELRTR